MKLFTFSIYGLIIWMMGWKALMVDGFILSSKDNHIHLHKNAPQSKTIQSPSPLSNLVTLPNQWNTQRVKYKKLYGQNDKEIDIKLENNTNQRMRQKMNRNLSSEFNSLILPIAQTLDGVTDGWALSYADLQPENERTAAGQAFLLTNLGYALAGFFLSTRGDLLLGGFTEVAGIVSYWYHYSQLKLGGDRAEVRLALFVDYFTAGAALFTGFAYVFQMGLFSIPLNILGIWTMAVISLSLGWVWEVGYSYLFWHSMWHILSAWTCYEIGQMHLA